MRQINHTGWVIVIMSATLMTVGAQISIVESHRRVISIAGADDGNTALSDEEEIEDSNLFGPFSASSSALQYPPGGAISEFGSASANLSCDYGNVPGGSFRAFGTTTAHAETINVSGFDPNQPPYNYAGGESFVYMSFEIGSRLTDYLLTATTFAKAPGDVLVFKLSGLKRMRNSFGFYYYARTAIASLLTTGTMTGTLDPLNDPFDRYEIEVYSRNNANVESDGTGSFEVVDRRNDFDFSMQLTALPPTAKYDAWVVLNFTTAQIVAGMVTDPDSDPDSDGICNLLEYAFNASPTVMDLSVLVSANGTAGQPLITRVGSEEEPALHFEFIRRRAATYPGVSYMPQVTTNLSAGLADWTDAAVGGLVNVTPIDEVWERVSIVTPTGASGAVFGRLKVTMP